MPHDPDIDLPALLAAARAATPGPWLWWTSCSFKRLGTPDRDGAVLHGYVQRSDGHPSVAVSDADAAFLELVSPDRIIALVERLQEAETARDRAVMFHTEEESRRYAAESKADEWQRRALAAEGALQKQCELLDDEVHESDDAEDLLGELECIVRAAFKEIDKP